MTAIGLDPRPDRSDPAEAGPDPAGGAHTPVLVARDKAGARMRDAIDAGRSVLVVGEAGTGKTALVDAVLARSPGRQGPRIVTVHAGSTDQRDLREALAPLIGTPPPAGAGELIRAIRRATGGDALVLRIEDAHLLDEPSRRWVGWWVREGDVTVVATLRRSAATQWPWAELWRNRTLERIDIGVLAHHHVQEYLERVLGGAVSDAVGWRLWLATAGVPERVASVAEQELAHGRLRRVDGVWHWRGEARPDARLQELVDRDLDSLQVDARATLETLAVIGPVPVALLSDLGPARAIEVLRYRGLVTVTSPEDLPTAVEATAGVTYPLYAEAIRAGMSPARSVRLFGDLKHLLGDKSSPRDVRSRLVAFGLRSGADVPDAAIRATVERAFSLSLGDKAVAVIDDALAAGVGDELHVDLLLYRAVAMRRQDDLGRAALDLDRAEAIVAPRSAELPALAVRVAMARAELLHFGLDDPDAALRLLAAAEATAAEAERSGRLPASVVTGLRIRQLAHALWAGRGEPYQTRARELLEAGPGDRAALELLPPLVLAVAQSGRPEAALRLRERFAPSVRAHREHLAVVSALLAGIEMPLSWWAGRSGGETTFDPVSTRAPFGAVAHLAKGFAAISQGVWSVAESELHAFAIALQQQDAAHLRRYVTAMHALAAAAAGQRVHARELVHQVSTIRIGRWGLLEGEVRLVLLDAAIWLGEPDAERRAAELAKWARARGDHRVELEALHRQCLLIDRRPSPVPGQLVERVDQLASLVDGRRCEALVAHAKAIARGDAQMAALRERALADSGLWLAPVPSTPVAALTRREREIARLAASGMSSRAIADRLVVSVRTVDTHLARAYAKLDVHSRVELARVMRGG